MCQPRHILRIFLIFRDFQPILLINFILIKKKCICRSGRSVINSFSSNWSTWGSQGKWTLTTKRLLDGKQNFDARILKLGLSTLDTYFVNSLRNDVTNPPWPLPLDTCVLSLNAGSICMSWLLPSSFTNLLVLLCFLSLQSRRKCSCTHKTSLNDKSVWI